MMYQTARNELQRPPHRVSLPALAFEAGVVIALATALVWLF